MARNSTPKPAGEQSAGTQSDTLAANAPTPAPPPRPEGDFLTLQCPPGAEQGTVSHGGTGYRAYLADHRDPNSAWHVDVPRDIAIHFIRAGFKLLGPAHKS
jgi:hypothetical protein